MRLPGPFPLRVSLIAAVLLAAPATSFAQAKSAAPAVAPAAEKSDDFKVSLLFAEQIDRFNPGVAASSKGVAAGGEAIGLDFAWRVADLPVKKKSPNNPRIELDGSMVTAKRVLAQQVKTEYDSTLMAYPDSIEILPDAQSVELLASLKIGYPIGIVNNIAQSMVYLRIQSGAIFAEHMTGDLLGVSSVGLGVERLSGTFDGSFAELAKGRDATFGSEHASGRYFVHVLLQGNLPPPEGSKRTHSNLSAFADLEVNTDDAGGPDGVRALLGLKLEGGGLFDGLRALLGM